MLLGGYDEALEAYTKAIEINPDYWRHYLGLGDVLVKLHKFEEAREAFREMNKRLSKRN